MSCSRPVTMKITDRFGVQHYPTDIAGKPIAFPCGYCVGCKTDKINQWSRRITYEYLDKPSSFVALTYDCYHLNYNTGFYIPTLRREDLHCFVDNLHHYVRKHPDLHGNRNGKFKVFCVGEYGSENGRPHYHLLILGLSPQYCAHVIPQLWKKGASRVDPMMSGSVRYVLKYMSKQQNKDYNKMHFTALGLDAPFISASPGIGAEFFMAHADEIRKYGFIIDGTHNIPVPNYWKNKIFNQAPLMKFINSQIEYKKRLNERHENEARSHGYYSYDEYIIEKARIQEENMVKDMRRQGIPVEDYYNFGHKARKVPKNFSLIDFYKNNAHLACQALDEC